MELTLSPSLQTKLDRLAASQGRDSHVLIMEAVERMVDYDEWFIAEVEKGLEQIESGKILSHEDVGFKLEKYLAGKRQNN